MMDAYAVRQELGGLPSRFDMLEDSHFPLVLSFDMLLELMDGQLQHPFLSPRTSQHAKVDITAFSFRYWPYLNAPLKRKAGSGPLVWSEMSSSIKGSIEAVKSAEGRLGREEYVALAQSRRGAALGKEQREAIYGLYRQYETMKREAGEWDSADMVAHVSRGWRGMSGTGGGAQAGRAKCVDFVYVDEVQDCCMGLLHLLG
jgi:hypothetical protein